MSDALMWPPIVVVFDILSDAVPEFAHSVHGVDVDIFCLDGSPKSLYPDVVLAAPSSVHAHADVVAGAGVNPQLAGVLAALVGIDDLRCAV